jgi:hypothetical protein
MNAPQIPTVETPVSCLMPTYAPQPVAFVRGEGVWLFDAAASVTSTHCPGLPSIRWAMDTPLSLKRCAIRWVG